MPSDPSHFHRGEIEETIIESFGNDHGTLDGYSRRTTLSSKIYHTKGRTKHFTIHTWFLTRQKYLLNCLHDMMKLYQ